MKINGDSLEIGDLRVTFHRTLRLPEDGKTHALPPQIGSFPLRRVDDYKEKVPPAWREHGGVFLPLYQREAMWLRFAARSKPQAVKVAAGKVNAVSGTPWSEKLEIRPRVPGANDDPAQDYMVCPPQPWLDGFNVGAGVVRQFVAMPLGMKYTVEAQVTGEEKFGGLQLLVIPPKAGGKADKNVVRHDPPKGGAFKGGGAFMSKGGSYGHGASGMSMLGDPVSDYSVSETLCSVMPASSSVGPSEGAVHTNSVDPNTLSARLRSAKAKSAEMGLAQGGQMKQKIYDDTYGIDAWNVDGGERIFVHIVNSELWKEITGEDAPETPISAQTYTAHGYPWFDIYDEHVPAVAGSSTLAGVKTISEMDKKHGFEGQQDDTPIDEKNVIKYGAEDKTAIRDGKW